MAPHFNHCFIGASVGECLNGDVVCSVSCIRMADTLNTRFTNCLYYNIIVITDAVLRYFLDHDFPSKEYPHASHILIYVAPSSVCF